MRQIFFRSFLITGTSTGVDATMLPVGQWRTFPLLLEHPEGNYEVRVEWSGAASIEVDSVVLLRVTE